MSKDTIRRSIAPFLAGCAVTGALLVAGVDFRPTEAQAQTAAATTTPEVRYSMRPYTGGANRLVADGASFEEIIPFKESPLFLTKNGDRLAVLAVTKNGLQILREFRLGKDFKEVVLLDDGASFAIRSSKEVQVHTVDRNYVTAE